MYPTLTIVLVETQRSMIDVCEIGPSNASKFAGAVSSEARGATSGHLSFPVEQIRTTMDSESVFLHSRALWGRDGQGHGLEKVILEVKESQLVGNSG